MWMPRNILTSILKARSEMFGFDKMLDNGEYYDVERGNDE